MDAALLGMGCKIGRRLIIIRQAVAFDVHFVFHQPSGVGSDLGRVFAGQQAAAQRAVGDDADLLIGGHRQDFDFGLAFDQVVHGLQAFDARQSVVFGDALRFHRLPGGPVAKGWVQDFALPHQVIQGAHGFFNRRVGVIMMQEIDVDAVGFQSFQALFDADLDVSPRCAGLVDIVAGAHGDFGCQDDFVAAAGDQAAEDLFGASAGIDIGAVEEVDAGFAAAMKHLG